MRIYKNINVFDAALDRMRFLFDEFEEVIVSISGGKDSTVIYNLAMIVAKEKNRLPLKVMFLDQEAEWDMVISHIRSIMSSPDVEPRWYQMPIKLFNATSYEESWLYCWQEGKKWMRAKEPNAITQNIYGTDRFKECLKRIIDVEYPNTKTCVFTGVRVEESPSRFAALANAPKYKWITWGKKQNEKLGHYVFCPIYDWSYLDIWKSIHDNKWDYCKLYDVMYQYGVPIHKMRVSNVHHETSVHSLFILQEIEPDTYERLTQRISGIDMAGKMGDDDFFVKDLPFMFKSWKEYRDYLLEKLLTNEKFKDNFYRTFERHERLYAEQIGDKMYKTHIQSILTNDWEMVKLQNLEKRPEYYIIRKHNKIRRDNESRIDESDAF